MHRMCAMKRASRQASAVRRQRFAAPSASLHSVAHHSATGTTLAATHSWRARFSAGSSSEWARVSMVGAGLGVLAFGFSTVQSSEAAAAASQTNSTPTSGASGTGQTGTADEYPSQLVRLHDDARSIFDAALAAADPRGMIRRALRVEGGADSNEPQRLSVTLAPGRTLTYDLGHFKRIVVVGAGKAACRMSQGAEDVLGSLITEGHVVTKYDHHDVDLSHIQVTEAAHPVPDKNSVSGARRISDLVSKYANDPNTLLVVLISGGGSALLVDPAGSLSLTDIQAANQSFLRSGMPIGDMNTLRKHMDDVKGGGLLRHAGSTPVLSLILSDVVGDDLNDIASGPTVPFERDYASALRLLDRFHLRPTRAARDVRQVPGSTENGDFPISVYEHLLARAKDQQRLANADPTAPDTIPIASAADATTASSSAAVPNFTNLLVGSNRHSLVAAAKRAQELGYEPTVLTDRLEGEAKDAAAWLSRVAIPVDEPGVARGTRIPRAFIAGGETTVTFVPGASSGLGGRNQEFALAGAVQLYEHEVAHPASADPRTVLIAAGTDGSDGPTDATGGVVDALTVPRARRVGLNVDDYLARHDSYHLFESLDARSTGPPRTHVKTGPTGTNVADVYIAITR